MGTKTDSDRPDPRDMRFEQVTEELEAIIDRIERGEIGLEASLAERKRGAALIKRSREILDAAMQELEHVTPPDAPDPPDPTAGAEVTDVEGER